MNPFKIANITLLSLVFFLCSCATNLKVVYDSYPSGALLHQGNRSFGYCPVKLMYNVSPEDKKRGYMIIRAPSVRWVSGATIGGGTISVNLRQGHNHQFAFTRPSNVPGYENDASFALELQRISILRKQAQAQAEFLKRYQQGQKQHQSFIQSLIPQPNQQQPNYGVMQQKQGSGTMFNQTTGELYDFTYREN